MKKFVVTINGSKYDVEVEEVCAAESIPAEAAAPAAAAPAVPAAPAASEAGEQILAPMPGSILKINASVGAPVKAGDVLMIMEAMKMENEIMAPCDGVVKSIRVSVGAAVDTDEILCVI